MAKKLLIDCMALCHASFHACKGKPLMYKGENVQIIYGFLNSVLDIFNEFRRKNDDLDASELVFIWDSKINYRKTVYFEEYKLKRKKDRDKKTKEEREALYDMFEQAEMLRTEILPDLGFKNVFIQKGMEGDDLLASVVLDEANCYHDFVMITQDKDMYQLLSPQVSFWNRKKGMYTYHDFRKEYRIVPSQWVDVKAIGGCASDAVPGVPGVGEKTVCKYLNKELKETAKAYQAITSEYGRAVANFNRVLVELPFPGTDFFDLKSNLLEIDKFIDLFEFYGFKSFLNDRDDEWDDFVKTSCLPF